METHKMTQFDWHSKFVIYIEKRYRNDHLWPCVKKNRKSFLPENAWRSFNTLKRAYYVITAALCSFWGAKIIYYLLFLPIWDFQWLLSMLMPSFLAFWDFWKFNEVIETTFVFISNTIIDWQGDTDVDWTRFWTL